MDGMGDSGIGSANVEAYHGAGSGPVEAPAAIPGRRTRPRSLFHVRIAALCANIAFTNSLDGGSVPETGPPPGQMCDECREVMIVAHIGQATTWYVCPCCGIFLSIPPVVQPPASVVMEKR